MECSDDSLVLYPLPSRHEAVVPGRVDRKGWQQGQLGSRHELAGHVLDGGCADPKERAVGVHPVTTGLTGLKGRFKVEVRSRQLMRYSSGLVDNDGRRANSCKRERFLQVSFGV